MGKVSPIKSNKICEQYCNGYKYRRKAIQRKTYKLLYLKPYTHDRYCLDWKIRALSASKVEWSLLNGERKSKEILLGWQLNWLNSLTAVSNNCPVEIDFMNPRPCIKKAAPPSQSAPSTFCWAFGSQFFWLSSLVLFFLSLFLSLPGFFFCMVYGQQLRDCGSFGICQQSTRTHTHTRRRQLCVSCPEP